MLGLPNGTTELLSRATRRRMVASVAGSVLLSLLDMTGVLAMLPMMQLVAGTPRDEGVLGVLDRALGGADERTLVTVVAGAIVAAFAVKGIVSIFFRAWQLRFLADQEVTTSTRMLRGYLQGPYAWHLNRNTADMIWTVETAVMNGFSGGLTSGLSALTEGLTILLIFGALLVVTPVPTLVALAYFGLAGLVLQRTIRARLHVASERNVAASKSTAKTTLQAFGAVKEIKLRRTEDSFVDRYSAARREGARSRATALLLGELPKYLLEIVFVLGIALLALVVTATSGSQQGLVTLGVFVAAGSRVLPSTVRLIASVGGIRFGRWPLTYLVSEHRLQREAEAERDEEVRTPEVPTGDIVVEGLGFSYTGEPGSEVLRGVDAVVPTGASVALVGSSGAGKSTLVDLLLGLHRPTRGRITAGGIDVFDNLPAWQRQLAVVPQEVYLLDESLRANILFDEPDDPDLLAAVIVRAQLGDLVASLPEGLDTEVGERGVRLSGGQRQRIGIARALYRSPKVLVLDEATSALDNETERRLTETIESLKGTMTMIIVAHRLSTVRRCDQLIFMSQGQVADVGSFDEVAAANAEFSHLVSLGSLEPARQQ